MTTDPWTYRPVKAGLTYSTRVRAGKLYFTLNIQGVEPSIEQRRFLKLESHALQVELQRSKLLPGQEMISRLALCKPDAGRRTLPGFPHLNGLNHQDIVT